MEILVFILAIALLVTFVLTIVVATGIAFRMLMYGITDNPEWSVFESDKYYHNDGRIRE